MAGIYIHIPFCKQACNYCNFHFSTSLKLKNDLIVALMKEIQLTRHIPFPVEDSNLGITFYSPLKNSEEGKEVIDTLYFGGGTPSILDITDLQLIFNVLQEKFIFKDTTEITLEANPDDITPEKLLQWKKAGINRLSVGIQSFVENELINPV